jgi:hypothetical protein
LLSWTFTAAWQRLLLELAEDRDGRLVIGERLTQQDIASRVGASREMVSRILKDLSLCGVITQSRAGSCCTANRQPAGSDVAARRANVHCSHFPKGLVHRPLRDGRLIWTAHVLLSGGCHADQGIPGLPGDAHSDVRVVGAVVITSFFFERGYAGLRILGCRPYGAK